MLRIIVTLKGSVHESRKPYECVDIEKIPNPKSDSNSSHHEFNESDLSLNYEIDEKLGKFKCDLCTEMFSSESSLMTHLELKHDVSFSQNQHGKIYIMNEFACK